MNESSLDEFCHRLLDHDPVARWSDLSGGNDHTYIHGWQVGTGYLVLVTGGGADLEVHRCANLIELTSLLAEESRRGERGDGWSLDLYALNHMVDMTPAGIDADDLLSELDNINIWAEVL